MSEAYQKYDDDFKKKVVAQVESGRRATDVARQFNISAPNIRYWRQKFEKEKKKEQKNKEV